MSPFIFGSECDVCPLSAPSVISPCHQTVTSETAGISQPPLFAWTLHLSSDQFLQSYFQFAWAPHRLRVAGGQTVWLTPNWPGGSWPTLPRPGGRPGRRSTLSPPPPQCSTCLTSGTMCLPMVTTRLMMITRTMSKLRQHQHQWCQRGWTAPESKWRNLKLVRSVGECVITAKTMFRLLYLLFLLPWLYSWVGCYVWPSQV